MTADKIIAGKPDLVIMATGGENMIPAIDGMNQPNVCSAWQILKGKWKAWPPC
jgi:hypothetical protein